eukprot:681087-Pyramimonas_sp.AAC.1
MGFSAHNYGGGGGEGAGGHDGRSLGAPQDPRFGFGKHRPSTAYGSRTDENRSGPGGGGAGAGAGGAARTARQV